MSFLIFASATLFFLGYINKSELEILGEKKSKNNRMEYRISESANYPSPVLQLQKALALPEDLVSTNKSDELGSYFKASFVDNNDNNELSRLRDRLKMIKQYERQ